MAFLSEKPRGFVSDTSSLTLTLVILGKFYTTKLHPWSSIPVGSSSRAGQHP